MGLRQILNQIFWTEKERLRNVCSVFTLIAAMLIVSVGIRLTQAQVPELLAEHGHRNNIEAIVFSPDGKTLASAGDDEAIKLWDVSSSNVLRTFSGHTSNVNSVIFSPNGMTLVSGSGGNDCTIRVWDVETGKQVLVIKQDGSDVISLSYDPAGGRFASGTFYGHIDIWDVKTGIKLRSIGNDNHYHRSSTRVIFSPDGKTLVSADGEGWVNFWNPATGQKTRTVRGHVNGVAALAFTPDGQILAARDDPGGDGVRLWDVASGKELKILKTTGDGGLAISHDGKFLAGGGSFLWNLLTGEVLRKIDQDAKYVSFSPDDKLLAGTDSDDGIMLRSVDDGEEIGKFRGYRNRTESITFDPGGKEIITGNLDNTVMFWDIDSGKPPTSQHFLVEDGIVLSPDGNTFVISGGFADRYISFIDTKSGQEIKRFASDSHQYSSIFSVAFSPDGRILASGDDRNITLWDVASASEIRTLSGHTDRVQSVTFSVDGKTLASGSDDGTIKLWNIATGSELKSVRPQDLSGKDYGNVYPLKFGPKGNILAYPVDGSGSIALWNIDANSFLRFSGRHDGGILSLAFSRDGQTLATGSTDKVIKLWNTNDGKELKTLTGHSDFIWSLSFRADGKILVSGGGDATVKLWDTRSGNLLCNMFSDSQSGDWLVTTPNGFFDGTPRAWKQLIWRFGNKTFDYKPVEVYFNDFFHPGLLRDVIAGQAPTAKPGLELNSVDRRQPIVKVAVIDDKSGTAELKRVVRLAAEVTDDQSAPRQAGAVRSSGARDTRLFRNGNLVRFWHGDIFMLGTKDGCRQIAVTAGSPQKAVCEVEVPITADKNEFTAYAFNHDNVKSNDSAPVVVNGAASLKQQGSLYVLAVGVNKYDYPTTEHDLTFAVPDIESITAELEKRQAGLRKYSETNVIKLTNENASKSDIMLALGRFLDDTAPLPATLSATVRAEIGKIKRIRPEDAIVIYYSGHGTTSGDRFYLIPHDGFPKNAADSKTRDAMLQKQSISDLELAAALENVQAGQILMVIDACHSGAVEGEEKRRGPMNSRGLAQLAYEKGMFILTASQSFQSANEAAKVGDRVLGHGFLTFELLEAMNDRTVDKDKNGTVVEREWFDYAVEQVPRLQQKTGPRKDAFVLGPDNAGNVTQTPRIFYPRDPNARPFAVFKP